MRKGEQLPWAASDELWARIQPLLPVVPRRVDHRPRLIQRSRSVASPVAVSLTGSNGNDIIQLLPLINAIPAVRGRRGRPRQRPDRIYADRAYDDKYRRLVRAKGITPVIARHGVEPQRR